MSSLWHALTPVGEAFGIASLLAVVLYLWVLGWQWLADRLGVRDEAEREQQRREALDRLRAEVLERRGRVGCISPKTITGADDQVGPPTTYFMSHDGPYRIGAQGWEYLGTDRGER